MHPILNSEKPGSDWKIQELDIPVEASSSMKTQLLSNISVEPRFWLKDKRTEHIYNDLFFEHIHRGLLEYICFSLENPASLLSYIQISALVFSHWKIQLNISIEASS